MPRKNVLLPIELVAAADLSANYTSPITQIQYLDNVAYFAIITGASAAGTLDVQVSLDYQERNGTVFNAGTWQSLGSNYQATVAGAGSGVFDLNQLGPAFVRLFFTRTGGTGTMALYMSGKEI